MTRGIRTGNNHTSGRSHRHGLGPHPMVSDVAWYRPRVAESRLVASILLGMALVAFLAMAGCGSTYRYDPERATRSYPYELHTTQTVDIQVFRDETDIELVNSTGTSYADFDLWINQRYVARVDSLPAGSTRRFSLWDFYDELGESLNAGGFFRTREPDKVRLVEIQLDDSSPMIGLITIRSEDVRRREPVR